MDITQLVLDDHHEQRRLFAILEQIDRGNTAVLSAVWDRLAAFLDLHAQAEEEIFYPELLQVGIVAHRREGVEDETLDAIKDHNEIRDAVAEVARHAVGTDEWFQAVAPKYDTRPVSADPQCGQCTWRLGRLRVSGTGPPARRCGALPGGAIPALASLRRPAVLIQSVVQAGASTVRTST